MRHIDGKLETELKRGILQIAVLSLLCEARYGYQLGQVLAAQGLAVEEGTLYPILRRMEQQGLLESRWVTEQSRPRKYYETTADGRESLDNLLAVWARVDDSLRSILALAGSGQAGTGGSEGKGADASTPPSEEGVVDAE